jgi:uncharacterized protein (DUF433 family)
MNWRDRITIDSNSLVGKPIVKGTHISMEVGRRRMLGLP